MRSFSAVFSPLCSSPEWWHCLSLNISPTPLIFSHLSPQVDQANASFCSQLRRPLHLFLEHFSPVPVVQIVKKDGVKTLLYGGETLQCIARKFSWPIRSSYLRKLLFHNSFFVNSLFIRGLHIIFAETIVNSSGNHRPWPLHFINKNNMLHWYHFQETVEWVLLIYSNLCVARVSLPRWFKGDCG